MGALEIVSLILALILGVPLGCGIAFSFWGSLLSRSNTHGDYVGESSKYTKGLKYSDSSTGIRKKAERDRYITVHYKALQKDAIFKNNTNLVKRPVKKEVKTSR